MLRGELLLIKKKKLPLEVPFAPNCSLRSEKKLFLVIREKCPDTCPLVPACFSRAYFSLSRPPGTSRSPVAVGSGLWVGSKTLGSVFLPLHCFVYLWSPWLASGACVYTLTLDAASLSLWAGEVMFHKHDGAGLPLGSLKADGTISSFICFSAPYSRVS